MAPNLEHRCLGTERGLPLDKAELTDQQRLGLLLEGCALLACLKLAGERPRVDWSGVRVTASGRLVRARRRSSSSAPMLQSSFYDLLARLFGIGGGGEVDAEAAEDLRIAGPGVGRRSARRLLTLWRQRVEPVSIDRRLEEIFCAAPFLWRRRFSEARTSLACVLGEERRASVVGPGAARRRLLHGIGSYGDLVERLRSDRCRSYWYGSSRSSSIEEKEAGLLALELESSHVSTTALRPAVREARAGLARGDGERAASVAAEHLRLHRRGMPLHEALRMWILLGQARELTSQLAGAERALLHAFRLAERSQLESLRLEVLVELAGVRLRRRPVARAPVARAEVVIDLCLRSHERSSDWGVVLRCGLRRAQLLLARGEANEAGSWCRYVTRRYGAVAAQREIDLLGLLAARAAAWSGSPEEARAQLREIPSGVDSFLDPEERSALYAQPGLRDRVVGAAAAMRGASLWRAIVDDREIDPVHWEWLLDLSPYRRARAVFDLVLVAPGRLSPTALRSSASTLERLGMHEHSARVASELSGAWVSLNRYLDGGVGDPPLGGSLRSRVRRLHRGR